MGLRLALIALCGSPIVTLSLLGFQPALTKSQREYGLNPPPLPEQHILDYKVEHHNQEIVVEGVCKGDESDVGCWKPNGEPDAKLSAEVRSMIKTQTPFGESQLRFNKKNRLLILRQTSTIDNKIRPTVGPGLSSYGLDTSRQDVNEGWSGVRTYSQMKERFRGNDPLITREVYLGWFDRGAKTTRYQHQFVDVTTEHIVIPPKVGRFKADRNDYEITQIKDESSQIPQPNSDWQTGGTLVGVRQINAVNPNTILNVLPANEKGVPYAGNNIHGDPIDLNEYNRLMKEWQREIQVAQKPGADHAKASPSRPQIGYLAWLLVDPYQGYPKGTNQAKIGIQPNKIKKLFVQIFHRRAVSLDNIHLDPK